MSVPVGVQASTRGALTPATGDPSPAAWAAAEYHLVRRHIVDGWCARLGAALHDGRVHSGVRLGAEQQVLRGIPPLRVRMRVTYEAGSRNPSSVSTEAITSSEGYPPP